MRIVLDTNVLVSGLLSPFGAPGRIVQMVAAGEVVLCYDARIASEYREVLSRPVFGFPADRIEALLEQVRAEGEATAAQPLAVALPDPDGAAFLEVAIAAGADCLVTGNPRHFPARLRSGVVVISPSEFLARWRPGA